MGVMARVSHRKSILSPRPAGEDTLYRYTADLLCLDFCRPDHSLQYQALQQIASPLPPEAWDWALAQHPDRAFARYIVDGLHHGFRIGFNRQSRLHPAAANMKSALEQPQVIDAYLAKELSKGRMLGPFSENSPLLPPVHINRVGVVPKGHNTGKWRLITDLSHPPSHSVNDGIDPSLCSLAYATVDDVAGIVVQLGRGSLLSKIDIESAYRLIPVHPDDRPLQAIKWKQQLYVDPMLPFGLRSAPKIFSAVADALNWCLNQAGIRYITHYLDDFIFVTPPGSSEGSVCMETLNRVCQCLGVPIAEEKRAGPTVCLVFLGIEIDTDASVLRLPQDKLQRIRALLEEWGDRRSCYRKELESLIGLLNHACKVVRPGRSFLRRMINLLHSVHRPPHSRVPIRLNASFRADLAWWKEFIGRWNGVSYLPNPLHLPTMEMASDASGSWGCGAWHGNLWFQLPWDSRSQPLSIAAKELLPIILACTMWGHLWRNHRVICHCDNKVVVACLQSRSSRDNGVMHLLRCLVFVEAQFQFFLYPSYINTRLNHLADDLSRNRLSSFISKVPGAVPHPSPLPTHLLDLLLNMEVDWTSPTWRHLFTTTYTTA